MKKKIKVMTVCLVVGVVLSSCALFGERKKCPAYSQNTPEIENSKILENS